MSITYVESGQSSVSTVIFNGDSQIIHSGGKTSSVFVSRGGIQIVSMGGLASSSFISAKGKQIVSSGGSATNARVLSGGLQILSSGMANNCSIMAGGQKVSYAAVASGTVIFANGWQDVLRGGQVFNTRISSGGGQFVSASGKASVTVVYGGSQDILNGGEAISTTVSGGGVQDILMGGHAASTTVSSAGEQKVWNGGHAGLTSIGSGGQQAISSGGVAANTYVSGGTQTIFKGGVASQTEIFSRGQQIVSSGGLAVGTRVSSGGMAILLGSALNMSMLASTTLSANGGVLSGFNRINAVTSALGRLRLASGAALAISGRASANELNVAASAGSLNFLGAGAKLKSISITKDTSVNFDIGKLKAGKIVVLKTAEKNTQKVGQFSLTVVAQQQMGAYGITQNVVQARNTGWTVTQRGKTLGTMHLNGSGFSKNGVTYSMTAAKNKITVSLSVKGGKMLKGTNAGEEIRGTANSDIFYGGKGNDTFRNGNGRDCAVYGGENWGQDVITKTSGTLALIFKGISDSDVVQKLAGGVMTVTKKGDPRQSVTISGWNSATHSAVFNAGMKAVDSWIKAASPTAAQTAAARNEVWKAAGLLAG